MNDIEYWLKTTLGLELKPGTRLLRVDEGMMFLGFRVMPDRLLLDRRARRRFLYRLTVYEDAFNKGNMNANELQSRVDALL